MTRKDKSVFGYDVAAFEILKIDDHVIDSNGRVWTVKKKTKKKVTLSRKFGKRKNQDLKEKDFTGRFFIVPNNGKVISPGNEK